MFSAEKVAFYFSSQKGIPMKQSLHQHILRLVLAALFLALAYVMPFLTGQIPEIGSMLCPMHLPVLLCGFLCGPFWGAVVGFTAPLMRSMILTMPPLFPTAVCMAFELMIYGLASGLLTKILPKKLPFHYLTLILSMIAGRVVWGCAMLICMGVKGQAFTFSAFLSGAITNAIPGILLQILLIPPVVRIAGVVVSKARK